MRMHSKFKTLALALPLAILGSGCILIPEIEERIVELAVGHSIVVPFTRPLNARRTPALST